ncbi:Vigilin [Portunus trituberculatus]|uniref:Vigilin n=1 Tax=Portunus trituberculatus TaxID=210409 RepID=A0A5B7HKT3_PORTR|nr:Vigilin [Portunus trituberculatus]
MTEQVDRISTSKTMKKGYRFLKGLKKLLCCCWFKAQQQDEEAEEYVVVEPPLQDEGEKDGVCEESDSLADSTSETAQSLPMTCGQSPECESAQSLSEDCEALEDHCPPPGNVKDTEQVAYIDEALIEKIYALIEEPVKPSATEAPECVEEQDKAETQTERCAPKRRRRRKKVRHGEENDGAWQVVCKKPKRKESEAVVTPAITPPKPEPQSTSRRPKYQRRGNKCREDGRYRVRLSWQESTVKVAVPVPPNRRRHVIGTRGSTIRQLQQQYPAVRVSVPLPQDLTSREVTIEGPKTQADAVALQITRRLQAVEEKLREAEQRRQERKVEVPPDMRRLVVGPRGETLRRLAQEHPAVRVTVPPPSDTQTASVTIRGPRLEVAVVADCIRACLNLQAAGQRQRQPRPNKRKQ